VECAALVVGEIITFVIGHEVDDGPFGKGRRLIEDQASLLDMGSERAHVDTVGFPGGPASVPRGPTEFADLVEPRNHLTSRRSCRLGAGYAEGTLFPWTMSDFSLMDAIECGIVK